jgi:hypothetical protein
MNHCSMRRQRVYTISQRRSPIRRHRLAERRQPGRILFAVPRSGLTVLGMMGEAQKLSDQESAEFTRRFLRCVNDRVPVIVGVSNPGTANLVKLSKVAMDAGALGVMVAPLTGLKTEAQIVSLLRRRDRSARRENSGRFIRIIHNRRRPTSLPELPQGRRRAPKRSDVQARGLPRPQEAHADTYRL